MWQLEQQAIQIANRSDTRRFERMKFDSWTLRLGRPGDLL
jgi:hypothetical protein